MFCMKTCCFRRLCLFLSVKCGPSHLTTHAFVETIEIYIPFSVFIKDKLMQNGEQVIKYIENYQVPPY